MAEATVTFTSLRNQLRKAPSQLAPVYLLHGEEGFYIDQLVKDFEALVPEADRDFNLYNLYAPELTPAQVMDYAMRYPMMADRQVVILHEAQAVPAQWLDNIASYVAQPNPSTVFVICSRGAAAKGKELKSALKKSGGVVFESKKLQERNVKVEIERFIKDKGLNVDPKSLQMLADYVGTDLSRLYNEIDKLTVTLPKGAMVTPEAVEANIGISKDYNNFELVAAVAKRDYKRALTIVDYFRSNPKNNPYVVTASTLFNFFTNVLIAIYTSDQGDHSLMAACGYKWPGQLTDLRNALRHFNAWHAIEIINAIRRYDAQSKGIGSRRDPYELLQELVLHILYPTGHLS